jgi:hypothetical protein
MSGPGSALSLNFLGATFILSKWLPDLVVFEANINLILIDASAAQESNVNKSCTFQEQCGRHKVAKPIPSTFSCVGAHMAAVPGRRGATSTH